MNADCWQAFVPDVVLDAISEDCPAGEARLFDAATLFVDVRGFTGLSEELARQGRRGSEQLAQALCDFFDPLVELARAYGGRVLEFSGDAMTVLFPYAAGRRRTAATSAARCALELQDAVDRYRAHTPTPLAVKAGVAQGRVMALVAGDPGRRLLSVVTGSPLLAAVAAEKRAGTGEVVADPSVLQAGVAPGRWLDGGRAVLTAMPSGTSEQPGTFSPESAVDASSFLPASVATRLRAGHIELLGEHRRVTTVFAYVPAGVADSARRIDSYVSAALQTVDRYGGWLTQIDTDDRGLRLMATFGAFVQHEDDPDRALRFAIDLRELDAAGSGSGIATGSVYCGPLGARDRRDFGVLGDSVNVAARLASIAEPGETLVTETTCRETRRQFALSAPRTFTPRGKTTRVEVRSLRGIRRTPARATAGERTLPLVGRRQELARLEGLLAEAGRGRGWAVGVVGTAGIGKTRLVAELSGQAAKRGFVVHSGACESYADPYAVWRGVWRSVLGIGESWSPARTQAHLESHLRSIDPRLGDRAPLLRGVLGIDLADTPLTASMAPDVAAASLETLLADCLSEGTARAPVLLVLEDCHWIDEDSLRLLDSLVGRALRLPVLLVATYRGDADQHRLDALRSAVGDGELHLAPLTAHETGRLAREALGGGDEVADVAARIELIAQGNPLYVEELARLIRTRPGALEPSSVGDLDLPDRLQSLVLARVDQLPETVKSVLKVASVVGGAFQSDVVAGSYPPLTGRKLVADALEELVQLDLAAPSGHADGFRFRHSLIEEVVYNSLSIAAREELHERVGSYMEACGDSATTVDILAYHYGRSARLDKQREYFRRAGDAARERHAGEAALAYYERLVPLLAGAERGEAILLAGQTAQFVGRWEDAETHYREALTLARAAGDERAQATAEAALGRLLSFTESHEAALASLRTADDRFRRLGDLNGRRGMLESLAITLLRAGEPDAARRTAEEHLSLALAAGDRVEARAALNNLGAIAWRSGDHDTALRSLRRALEDATAADDAARVAHAANDLAGVHAELGDHGRALTHVQLGIDAATRIGYPQLRCLLVGNAGELYRHRGAYSKALACYGEALDGALALGDTMQSALFAGNAAAAALALGRREEAEALLAWALPRARRLGEPYLLGELLFLCSLALGSLGRDEEALELADESRLTATGHHAEIALKASVLAQELRVRLGLAAGQRAIAALEELLGRATEDWARAAVLAALARIEPARSRERALAATLYRRLFEASGNVEFSERYAELSGDVLLPPPDQLETIAPAAATDADPLAAILERIAPQAAPGIEPGKPPARAASTAVVMG